MSDWIYMLGEDSGGTIKIGKTKDLRQRVNGVNSEQTTNAKFIFLAAAVGTPTHEATIKDYFSEFRCADKGSKREYFSAQAPVLEYTAWLRGQWFAATDPTERLDGHPCVDASFWLPHPDRRFAKPKDDSSLLIQTHATQKGCLPEPYSWFPNPQASFKDYFTPPEIIERAREAMGGIDLDAASHWAANKMHRIPDYFDASRSAFQNDWHGKVWLNPPYGDYGKWFDRALHFVQNGEVQQLCMISPVWAFTTKTSKEFMAVVSAIVLLMPTPKFWGNADPDATGSNHPHAVVYIGNEPDRFIASFVAMGIPMRLGV